MLEKPMETGTDIESRNFDKLCFVQLCYSSYLGRCGEQAGINNWLNVLGNASPNRITNVAVGFITSAEAANKWEHSYVCYLSARGLSRNQISKNIYIAYRGLLLREPDVGGGQYWTGVVNNHGLWTAVSGIGSSVEFSNRLRSIRSECNAYNATCH